MPLSWTRIFAGKSPLDDYPELVDDKHIPLLKIAIWVMLGGAAVFMALLLISPQAYRWRIYSSAGLVALAATAHVVLRYRGAIATVRLLVIGCWLLATSVSFVVEGVRTPILLAYPIILIFGGWLLGARACVRLFIASSVAVIAMAIGQQAGLIGAAKPIPPAMAALVYMIVLLTSAVMTLYLLKLFRDRYGEERRLNDELKSSLQILKLHESEQKRAEEEIRQLNLGLEQRVAERTAELEKAKDAALAADRAKSDFLTSMSHEIRTPLNAILGFSQLIDLTPDLPEETKDNAREIMRAGQHLLELINEVLDLARIEAKQLGLALKPVPVKSLLADCLGMIRPIADKHGIELVSQDGVGETAVVFADYVRLRQVVLNLLSNGIKYNQPKGRVILSSETIGGSVRVSVGDSGPGIPADKQTHLFNSFDRIGKEAGTVEGTGIGLVISKRLVEAMGGRIGFESIEGQGSTFWVELPLSET